MKTTEELAREAGIDVYGLGPLDEIERFRQLVRNEALEECAQLAEAFKDEQSKALACGVRALKK